MLLARKILKKGVQRVVDIIRETRLSVNEAAKFAGVTRQTIHGWMARTHGKRLESAKLGGKRITTREAIQRFLDQEESGTRIPIRSVAGEVYANHERALAALDERHR